jgi:excisionase family DNA binding protein
MHRRLQFGMRENPASERRHGSRAATDVSSSPHSLGEQSPAIVAPHVLSEPPIVSGHSSIHAAKSTAATGERNANQHRLLTIQEVADLLQVPVSWVYGHTRHRSVNRIPGIRLGKYWRFERADVEAWIDANRRKDYTRVG